MRFRKRSTDQRQQVFEFLDSHKCHEKPVALRIPIDVISLIDFEAHRQGKRRSRIMAETLTAAFVFGQGKHGSRWEAA